LNVVGIVCALPAEARHLGPARRRGQAVAALAGGTLLAVNGMGFVAATGGARALIEAGADALLSFGLAGGLDPALEAGTVLLPRMVLAPGRSGIATAEPWRERVRQALGTHLVLCEHSLLSSATAVASIDTKRVLFRETGAAAVDMESYAIAELASARRLPFLAVRVIVDGAADRLPRPVAAAADAAGSLRIGRLLAALASAPFEIAPLLRLARRYRTASRSLAVVGPTVAAAGLAGP